MPILMATTLETVTLARHYRVRPHSSIVRWSRCDTCWVEIIDRVKKSESRDWKRSYWDGWFVEWHEWKHNHNNDIFLSETSLLLWRKRECVWYRKSFWNCCKRPAGTVTACLSKYKNMERSVLCTRLVTKCRKQNAARWFAMIVSKRHSL